MTPLHRFEPGGYRFLEGGFPYCQGVAAEPGYEIVRARFRRVTPIAAGFAAIERHLKSLDRPLTALCAAELRSPKPFSMEGFREFNTDYVGVLKAWNLYRDKLNPVARSNLAPVLDPPAEPGFFAFSYTVPAAPGVPLTFVIAGNGEWPEGGRFPEDIVRRGETSPDAVREKAQHVAGKMEARMRALGANWREATAVHVYTALDVGAVAAELNARGFAGLGFNWFYVRPPIVGLEFEMDMRGVRTEIVLD
jgi:hypothetical protein